MVIKIQTQKAGIPVQIGDLKFAFDTSDEGIQNLKKSGELLLENADKINDDDFDAAKDLLKQGYDLILGEGTFDQVYNEVKSLIECMRIFGELSKSINQELSKMNLNATQQDKAQQYIRQKRKPKHKNKK